MTKSFKVRKTGILFFFAALLFALFIAAVAPVFASRVYVESYRAGSMGYGVYQRKGDVPLNVKSFKLTFNISDFPQVEGLDLNYRSNVTGEYVIYNPSDEAVTAQLIIPETEAPNYFGRDFGREPQVKVNGEGVQTTVRYLTERIYGSNAPIELSDEWYSDGFFNPDLPVHVYKVSASANFGFAYLKGDIINDYTKARYISDGYNEFSCNYSDDGDNLFYILGDESAVDFSKLSFYDYDHFESVKLSDSFTVDKVETTTLRQLILQSNRPVDGVSDIDWYNGMTAGFSNNECVCTKFDLRVNGLNKFYTYSVELAPHGEISTSFTVPVFPDVYSQDDCRYYFDLSSAASWGGFGKAEVEIVTGYNIYDYSSDFKQTPTGFKATYGVVPEGEVRFALGTRSTGPDGYNEPDDITDVLLAVVFFIIPLVRLGIFIIGGGIAFIVIMVKKSKKTY